MKMALSSELNTNIEGAYYTTTTKVTQPRLSYKISVSSKSLSLLEENVHHCRSLQKRMHIILCYKKQSNNNIEIKESLSNALNDHPILAGRLRRSDYGGLEIVSNDGGVRVVEAQMPLTLVDFLEIKEKNNGVEGKLVHWENVDETFPRISPLFYIQVTTFKCGGYAIGISYNLLLIDPLSMAKFLNNWTEIHKSILVHGSEFPRTPFHTFLNAKQTDCSSSLQNSVTSCSKNSKTMVFNITTNEKLNQDEEDVCKYFVQLCLKEIQAKFPYKTNSTFTLITKAPNGDAKVEIVSKQDNFMSTKYLRYDIDAISWEFLRNSYEVAFCNEYMPVDSSHWIVCDAHEEVILVVITSPIEGISGMKVYITFPNDQEVKF